MGEEKLKTAYELVLEKLQERDRERGTGSQPALDEDQKRRIAEIRTQATAKLAELEILWRAKKASLAYDPETLEKAEREYAADRSRVEERTESQIEKIRREK